MSTNDLRESSTRVDRSGLSSEPALDPPFTANRRKWAIALLLVPLALTLPAWLAEDALEEVTRIGGQAFGPASSPSIPLDVNESVEHWIEQFQTTRRAEFEELLEQRGVFEGLIRGKLRERNMPEDLLYLAMMESGLSTIAESRVSAVGLWQFMGPTARQMGLRVDEHVDERRDPVRATDAALDYLQWLRARFGSWYLAAAAFNAGPGRLERILHRHADGRTGDEDIYWEVLRYLPRETRDYVPRIVAATILANDADAAGLGRLDVAPYEFDMVFVPGRTPLTTVAESLNVDIGIVRDLNPHLIRGTTPPGEIYGVRVPVGGIPMVMAVMAQGPSAHRAD
ncbi:MAG: lytic transglycosylase domain-containing protein [Gemmatimonadota bacterium]|nr:lytic transglycosylase domain-containing protein [Gemmatimonadota bacterium]